MDCLRSLLAQASLYNIGCTCRSYSTFVGYADSLQALLLPIYYFYDDCGLTVLKWDLPGLDTVQTTDSSPCK